MTLQNVLTPSWNVLLRQLIPLCLVLLTMSAHAETRYVGDQLVITLRSGQGTEFQILRTLPSGTKLELLEDADKYSRVRTRDGTEGWVLNQYLVKTPIARQRLVMAEQKLARLEAENQRLNDELKALGSEKGKLSGDYRGLQKENKKLSDELTRLRRVAAKPLKLENENQRLKKELLELENAHELLEQENQVLSDASDRDWFLTGAGVVVLGILLGLIVPRLRPRRKSSWNSL